MMKPAINGPVDAAIAAMSAELGPPTQLFTDSNEATRNGFNEQWGKICLAKAGQK